MSQHFKRKEEKKDYSFPLTFIFEFPSANYWRLWNKNLQNRIWGNEQFKQFDVQKGEKKKPVAHEEASVKARSVAQGSRERYCRKQLQAVQGLTCALDDGFDRSGVTLKGNESESTIRTRGPDWPLSTVPPPSTTTHPPPPFLSHLVLCMGILVCFASFVFFFLQSMTHN